MVQRGDDRQYISRGTAEQDLSGQYAGMVNQVMGATQTIAQKANESDLASKQIDLATEFYKKNNEINLKYQADPTNPQRDTDLQEAFNALSEKYKVNPFVEKQWGEIKRNVYDRTKMYNAQWVEKQQQTNATVNLKNGYEKLVNQVSMLGMNGAGIEDVRLTYANGVEALRTGASSVLGTVVADNFLNDSTHDFMSTYVSALAVNNPLEAQKLLKDKGVRDDIGNAETIEKLESYVSTSLMNQNKRTAVNELGNTLRSMNSAEADDILNGKADLNKVMKFIQNNKKLPEGSKDLILDIYGIGSTTEYIYDRDKKKIVKKEETRRGRNGVSAQKMSPLEKKLCAEVLEQDLHKLLSFEDYGVNDVKTVKKNKTQQQASDGIVGYMQNVARMQERIDTAYATGAIDKSTRQRMMNQYISPVADYLESNLEQLDERSIKGIAGQRLGYDKIKKAFNTNGLKGKELQDIQTQKLFAQNYYLDELHKASQKLGLKNIYNIENLSSEQQQEIYKTASDNALKRAKRWTDKPEIFFAQEYPEISMQPSVYFKANKAKLINRAVAQAVYKREFENLDGSSKLDLKDYAQLKCKEEILRKYKEEQFKAGTTLGSIRTGEPIMTAPLPKTYNELDSELKEMGYTVKDFHEFAVQNGYVEPLNNNQWRQGGYLNKWYMNALVDLRQAKSMKNKGK